MINQCKCALELLVDMGLTTARYASTPMEQNLRLTTHEFDSTIDANVTDGPFNDTETFRLLVGHLLYLNMTGSDIAYIVSNLSQFVYNPKNSHYGASLRVV